MQFLTRRKVFESGEDEVTELGKPLEEGWSVARIVIPESSAIGLVTFTHMSVETCHARFDTGKVVFLDDFPRGSWMERNVELVEKYIAHWLSLGV